MEQLYWFGFAAAIAAIFKSAILLQVLNKSRATVAFVWVTVALIAQNLFELLTFSYYYSNPGLADWFLKGVLAAMIMLSVALANFVATVSETRLAGILRISFGAVGLALLTVLASGFLVTGAERGGYSVISTPAPGYPLFQLYIVATVLVCAIVLLQGTVQRANERVARRCRLVLMATIPMFAVGVAVVMLRLFGFDSSSAIFMPIASTYFVYRLMRGEKGAEDEIVVLKLKWARTWFFARQALKSHLSNDPVSLNHFAEQAELQLIEAAMKSCGNNMQKTAKLLQTSPSTISRRWARLKKREAENST